METRQEEYNKIRQVAKEYKKKGYAVIIEPNGNDIPFFIKHYQPDIIATSPADNVIVEVKTRSDFASIEKLRSIADVINKRDNWRFELIVTNTKQDNLSNTNRINTNPDITEIKKKIKEIKTIVKQGFYSAAFILCWANLESLSRQILFEEKKELNNKMPLVLIKTLFSLGHLTRTDYESLKKFFFVRNQIVHGFKAKDLDKKTVERLILISEKLLKETDIT
jgi:Holliday junction resolvase